MVIFHSYVKLPEGNWPYPIYPAFLDTGIIWNPHLQLRHYEILVVNKARHARWNFSRRLRLPGQGTLGNELGIHAPGPSQRTPKDNMAMDQYLLIPFLGG